MKKLVSLLLVLVMMLTCAIVASAEENIELTVMMYERGNTTNTYGSATDNFWTRWMQANFGDPNGITLKYIPVPRANDGEKVNTMMAGGSAPDIIFGYDSTGFMDFGKNGGTYELTELVEEYGPNLIAHLSDTFPYGVYEGNMWCLVAKRQRVGRYCILLFHSPLLLLIRKKNTFLTRHPCGRSAFPAVSSLPPFLHRNR